MKRVRFVGSAQRDLAAFPKAVRTRVDIDLAKDRYRVARDLSEGAQRG